MSFEKCVDGVQFVVHGNEMPQDAELKAYAAHAREKYQAEIEKIDLKIDGDCVDMNTYLKPRPFERIRRITGYLVGTLDRFNDAKRAEEAERVKHGAQSKISA